MNTSSKTCHSPDRYHDSKDDANMTLMLHRTPTGRESAELQSRTLREGPKIENFVLDLALPKLRERVMRGMDKAIAMSWTDKNWNFLLKYTRMINHKIINKIESKMHELRISLGWNSKIHRKRKYYFRRK